MKASSTACAVGPQCGLVFSQTAKKDPSGRWSLRCFESAFGVLEVYGVDAPVCEAGPDTTRCLDVSKKIADSAIYPR